MHQECLNHLTSPLRLMSPYTLVYGPGFDRILKAQSCMSLKIRQLCRRSIGSIQDWVPYCASRHAQWGNFRCFKAPQVPQADMKIALARNQAEAILAFLLKLLKVI